MEEHSVSFLCQERAVLSTIPQSLGERVMAHVVKAIQSPNGTMYMAKDYDWRATAQVYDTALPEAYTIRFCDFYTQLFMQGSDTSRIWNCHRFVSHIIGAREVVSATHGFQEVADNTPLMTGMPYGFMYENTLQHSGIAITDQHILALAGLNRSLQVMELSTVQQLWGDQVVALSGAE